MKVLANDGISESGILALEKGGFEVITTKVAQEQVANFVNENNVSVVLVRSATKVRKDIIDACPGLKIIGRGGVGMDNIDVDYAKSKGIHVINTPASSSESVADSPSILANSTSVANGSGGVSLVKLSSWFLLYTSISSSVSISSRSISLTISFITISNA